MSQTLIALILFVSFIGLSVGQTNRPQSECEQRRGAAQRSTSLVLIVPNCESNGEFSPLQCHSNSKFCQCWNSTGHPKSAPSTKIKRCECILERERVRESGGPRNPEGPVGVYVPQCNGGGGYEKKQCNGSTGSCWCVTEVGTTVTNVTVAADCA